MLVLTAVLASLMAPEGAAFRHGISPKDADVLASKLESIERREGSGPAIATVVVTERELNSYLNLSAPPKLPPELSEVEFRLEQGRIEARGMVDLDRLQGKPKAGAWNPLALLGGRVAVELRGRLSTADGFGSVEVDEVRLGSLQLPLSVLEHIVTSATRTASNPEGFDIRSRFPLPYAVKRLRFEPGRILLEF